MNKDIQYNNYANDFRKIGSLKWQEHDGWMFISNAKGHIKVLKAHFPYAHIYYIEMDEKYITTIEFKDEADEAEFILKMS